MKISRSMSDDAVLEEIGNRIARRRLDLQLTQADLAVQAGISKRTLERIEAGATAQTSSIVRVLRAMDSMQGLERLIPAGGPKPMDLLRRKGRERKRASSSTRKVQEHKKWRWGDST